jgi:hypothetical protein
MPPNVFEELVFDLKKASMEGLKKPVVLLGAGASYDANIPLMRDLIAHFGCTDYQQFFAYVDTLTPRRRLNRLAEFLQTQDPLAVTPGYRALAALVAGGYFDLILSTNMDPVLEDALAAANMRRQDYLLLVNGVVRVDRLDALFATRPPRVKVVKLHGDVFTLFMAWTPTEMDAFLADIGTQLDQLTYGHDLLAVGHSLADSPRIARLARDVIDDGGTLWFVNPSQPPTGFPAGSSVRVLNEGFEHFFTRLADTLGVKWRDAPIVAEPQPADAAPAKQVQTVDDLMQSVFALAPAGGPPSCTAFLLQEPRAFISDRYVTDSLTRKGGKLEIVDTRGRRHATSVIRHGPHPFGPALLEVDDKFAGRGFRVDPRPTSPEDAVRVGVAAGQRTGVSSGTVDQIDVAMEVPPVKGIVSNLATLKCAVAPGASGAPVVDDAFGVRGFIVGGSRDLEHPWSIMYPSAHWADWLAGTPRKSSRPQ